jgi:hypothetical protein
MVVHLERLAPYQGGLLEISALKEGAAKEGTPEEKKEP